MPRFGIYTRHASGTVCCWLNQLNDVPVSAGSTLDWNFDMSDRLPEQVSPELMEQLHTATEEFGSARKRLEEAMDAPTPEPEPRKHAHDEMLEAEQKIEDVSAQIHEVLKIPAELPDERRADSPS